MTRHIETHETFQQVEKEEEENKLYRRTAAHVIIPIVNICKYFRMNILRRLFSLALNFFFPLAAEAEFELE